MKQNLMHRLAVVSSLALFIGSPATSLAKMEAPTIQGKASVDFQMYKGGDGDYEHDLRTKNVELLVSQKITKNIRAVIKLEFERQLIKAGEEVDSSFDLEKAVEAAFIEIKNVGGQPIALVVGKHVMAYGKPLSQLPLNDDAPLHKINKEGTMIGVTLKLDKKFLFDVFDAAAISVYETEKGDLQLGSFDGVSVTLDRALTEKIKMRISGLHKGNGHNDDLGDDNRAGVGFVYNDGTYTAFVEGHVLIDSTQYPDSSFAVAGGVSREYGPGLVALEASYVENALAQIGLGYQLYVTKNVTIGPEIRYTVYEDDEKEDGVSLGVRSTVKFGHPDKHKKTLLD